jgi:prepilin-type processing-associated H-X9-DG protein
MNNPLKQPRYSRLPAFTPIELLVVISIITLLIGILLPALASARKEARVSACLANEHQIGLAVNAYAADQKDKLATGPATGMDMSMGVTWSLAATSQIWIGDDAPYGGGPNTPQRHFDGAGTLLSNDYLSDIRAPYCPGDPSTDVQQEQAKINTGSDAFGSYFYRQLQQTTPGHDRLDDLGYNALNTQARVIAWDRQTTIDLFPEAYRVNHDNQRINLLYTDGHAKSIQQRDNTFVITNADATTPLTRLDQIIQAGDALAGE